MASAAAKRIKLDINSSRQSAFRPPPPTQRRALQDLNASSAVKKRPRAAKPPLVADLNATPPSTSSSPQRRRPAWNIEPSELALRTGNAIRRVSEGAEEACGCAPADPENASKPKISLAMGDPTIFGHVAVSDEAVEAVVEALRSGQYHGYAPSLGHPQAREAVATFLSSLGGPHLEVCPADVYLTSGCGPAFQLSLEALARRGKAVLVPKPGFPTYEAWCAAAGLRVKYYPLVPSGERGWEVDLEAVKGAVDGDTAALLICNPGNPCGNVFSKKHLAKILGVAESLKLPVISDEIYGPITFGAGTSFTPLAAVASELHARAVATGEREKERERRVRGHEAQLELSPTALLDCTVPVLTVGSLSKMLLVPGWRLGWIAVHDPKKILADSRVVEALKNRLQSSAQPCGLIQGALPKIVSTLTADFFRKVTLSIEESLRTCVDHIEHIPELDCPSLPSGGMFLMVKIDMSRFTRFTTDVEWCKALLHEQSVAVIPGTACEYPGWFRVFLCVPQSALHDAFERIELFCQAHASHT